MKNFRVLHNWHTYRSSLSAIWYQSGVLNTLPKDITVWPDSSGIRAQALCLESLELYPPGHNVPIKLKRVKLACKDGEGVGVGKGPTIIHHAYLHCKAREIHVLMTLIMRCL